MAMTRVDDTNLVDEVVSNLQQERPDLDSRAIETVCRLIYVGRKMEQRAARVLAPYELNYTDLDVLATLRESGSPFELTPADLLRAVMITSGAMTTCLDRLEKAKTVRRRTSKDDRRVRKVSLTSSGKKLIDKVLTVRFEDARRMTSELSDSEIRKLNTLLKRVVAVNQACEPE